MAVNSSTKQKEVDVVIQDNEAPPVQVYLQREDKIDITLTSPITAGDEVIHVSAAHGFTATGEWVFITENGAFSQLEVKNVSTNDITLSRPIYGAYTTGAIVMRVSVDMNVNGSITPEEFVFYPRAGIALDIQTINFTIWNASAAGDDGKFGDLAILPNGFELRREGAIFNSTMGIYTTNADFKDWGVTVIYTDRSGGTGNYGEDMRLKTVETYGVVVRLRPTFNDKVIAKVRDNLSTLDRMRMSLMGQVTSGEG